MFGEKNVVTNSRSYVQNFKAKGKNVEMNYSEFKKRRR